MILYKLHLLWIVQNQVEVIYYYMPIDCKFQSKYIFNSKNVYHKKVLTFSIDISLLL